MMIMKITKIRKKKFNNNINKMKINIHKKNTIKKINKNNKTITTPFLTDHHKTKVNPKIIINKIINYINKNLMINKTISSSTK